MSLPLAAPALPLHTAGPYVFAAYIVFVVLILVYVTIMAVRLTHNQRDIARLAEEVKAHQAALEAKEAEERDTERVG